MDATTPVASHIRRRDAESLIAEDFEGDLAVLGTHSGAVRMDARIRKHVRPAEHLHHYFLPGGAERPKLARQIADAGIDIAIDFRRVG
jgi:hypothetical protein